jgi:mitochondrial distribution and morphology protein 12
MRSSRLTSPAIQHDHDRLKMSIDINWETLTGGPDGEALAEQIRSFIDEKFQQVTLPRFIQSVKVHSFHFGTVCPELEIKDICDPLPDFYEDDGDGDDEDEEEEETEGVESGSSAALQTDRARDLGRKLYAESNLPSSEVSHRQSRKPAQIDARSSMLSPLGFGDHLGSPFHPRAGASGIPGGTSNLSYFHLPLGGLSGTQTPLAAVAGGTPFSNGWHDHPPSQRDLDGAPGESISRGSHRYSEVSSSSSRPSTAISVALANAANAEEPPSPSLLESSMLQETLTPDSPAASPPPRMREKRTEDLQIVLRVKYAGDVRLSLTAEILLDYPMPSFVGIPLKLNITGLTFDGVAVLAYIRKRAHFCFLAPEDANALVGTESSEGSQAPNGEGAHQQPRMGGLLQDINVESEIGRKENGKQVLKNVGKVEKFVLEQVRRIFEEEFVFPSFWTILV